MPYSSVSEVPEYVPKAKRKQWLEVFNSAYAAAKKDGKTNEEAEASAFAQANGVAGPNSKKIFVPPPVEPEKEEKKMTNVNYVATAKGKDRCEVCKHFNLLYGTCSNVDVAGDPKVPQNAQGQKTVSATGWCSEFEALVGVVAGGDGVLRSRRSSFSKFVPFAKVDAARRDVWGIVTAEVPDKDDEVCDYDKSKPYYRAVIDEMSKATDGRNFFPLRAMHQLIAAGKCIGFEFRDADKEIFMGFKVVDDKEWTKVDEGVYTGFSQGGRIVGDMVPDPVFKNCMRYVANPSEASLVDNPCLGVAHFAYVKADGQIEMRKFKNVETLHQSLTDTLIKSFQNNPEARTDVLASLGFVVRGNQLVKAKTKRVAGEDLTSAAFAYVGDADDTATWELAIKFSSDAKTKRHIRNVLTRFGRVDVPADKKDAVWKKIVTAAKEHGIDAAEEKSKLAAITAYLRKQCRIRVNRLAKKSDPGRTLAFLDDDLGKLAKGMYEVSALAECVDRISFMVYQVQNEQEWEKDADSPLPLMLADNVNDLLDTLLAMVQEESTEMRDDIELRVAAKT